MNRAPTSFSAREAAVVAALRSHADPQERLGWVVRRAAQLSPFDVRDRTDPNLLKGCAARLWFVGSCSAGRCHFGCDSDSAILKAFAGLLCEIYDGLPPSEVIAHEPAFLAATGLLASLTENRRRTIARVRDAIREVARQGVAAA